MSMMFIFRTLGTDEKSPCEGEKTESTLLRATIMVAGQFSRAWSGNGLLFIYLQFAEMRSAKVKTESTCLILQGFTHAVNVLVPVRPD